MGKKKNIPHALSDDTLDNVIGGYGYTLQSDGWNHRPQMKPHSDSPGYDPMTSYKPSEKVMSEEIEA